MEKKDIKSCLSEMFNKVAKKTISREEGVFLINDLIKRDKAATLTALAYLVNNPPHGVFPATIIHTVALTKNESVESFFEMHLWHEKMAISVAENIRNDNTKNALARHLNSDEYHTRKAVAEALIRCFGREGIEMVKTRGFSNPEVFYRETSASALANAGRPGVEALLSIISSNEVNAIHSAAKALIRAREHLSDKDTRLLMQGLKVSLDEKFPPAALDILEVIASMGKKAEGCKEYIAALVKHPYRPIQEAARKTLSEIGAESAEREVRKIVTAHI